MRKKKIRRQKEKKEKRERECVRYREKKNIPKN